MSIPKPQVVGVGAGPGGLTAAMVLAHRGFEVHIFEKEAIPGGRNGYIELNGYRFDIGPTFLMMRHVLDGVAHAFEHSADNVRHDDLTRPVLDWNLDRLVTVCG